MISEQDKSKILEIAKKYDASRVLLFGSSIDPQKEAKDIDLAVEGVPDSIFFKFYNEYSPQQADGVSLLSFPQSFKRESIRSLTSGLPINPDIHYH